MTTTTESVYSILPSHEQSYNEYNNDDYDDLEHASSLSSMPCPSLSTDLFVEEGTGIPSAVPSSATATATTAPYPRSCNANVHVSADDASDAPLPCTGRGRRRRQRQRPPSRRPLSRLLFSLLAFCFVALTGASDPECPNSTNGWGASSDCKSYFWCSDGARSSITYECIQNTIYNVDIAQCVNAAGYECPGLATTTTSTVAATATTVSASATTPSATAEGSGSAGPNPDPSPTPPVAPSNPPYPGGPTAPPTKLGRPIYYGDFRTASCQSSLTFENAPNWISEEDMFSSKEECCKVTFSWAPLENCLGPDFVEDNYVVGSRPPTVSPTTVPSAMPSVRPSSSGRPSASPTVVASEVPSEGPSDVPSVGPSEEPSFAPSTPPPTTTAPTTTMGPTFTTALPTTGPTGTTHDLLMQSSISSSSSENSYGSLPRPTSDQQSQRQNNDNFLVQLLGWTNSDLTVLDPPPSPPPPEASSTSSQEHPQPHSSSSSSLGISTLTLPVLEDATVSKQRTRDNFGTNSALAVSAGSSSSEGFDSLLKFDVGIVDSSKVVESASLHIRSVADCTQGGTFTTTTSSSWESRSVTWENAPGNDGYIVGTLGQMEKNQWYELDMLPALQWNDALSGFTSGSYLSVRITTADDQRCMFASKESGESTAPYLTVVYREDDYEEESLVPQSQESSYGNNGGALVSNLSSPGSNAASSHSSSEPLAPGQFLLLRATDDATIDPKSPNAGVPSTQQGSLDPLLLKNAFDISNFLVLDFLIRFDLSEMNNTRPRTAVLTLYAESTCTSAGTFVTTSAASGDWSEDTVSWSNAPSRDPSAGPEGGTDIGTFGEVFKGNWYGFDVARAVADAIDAGKTSLTFRVSSGNSGVCEFSSRRSGRDAKLMVAF